MAIVRMMPSLARKLMRFAEWMKVSKAVKRYINEGNDSFSVSIGGFDVTFDAASETQKGESE